MIKNDMLWKLGIFFITIGLVKLGFYFAHVIMERRDRNASR